MGYTPLQKDIDILFQSHKEMYSKIEILTRDFKILDLIEGRLIDDSLSINADSDVRRTYSCNLCIEDNLWLKTHYTDLQRYYIRPYVGIRYMRTGEIIYYLMGTYCVKDLNYTYDSSTSQLSLSCEDLMCMMNGVLSGKIKDQKLKVEAGNNIRDTILGLLKEASIERYYVCDIDRSIPYDIEISASTYYDALKEIIELYTGYEMFFDVNGVFIIDKMPMNQEDENLIDDTIIQPLLISDNGSSTFQGVFNHIKVFGREIETDRSTNDCTYTNGIYYATNEKLTAYENFTTYSIQLPANCTANPRLSINNLPVLNIVDYDGNQLKENDLEQGMCSFRYRKLTNDFLYLGRFQIFGEAWDENPDSPFNINNLGYELCNVCQGNDFEKIYTDDLARKRARLEIYNATNLKNDTTLELMAIPWLDVNVKIEYTSHNFNQTYSYIIKSISGSTASTMSITMVRFYENYQEDF